MKNYLHLLLMCFSLNSIVAQDLNDGLIMHYTFSGNSNDLSGNEHHASANIDYVSDRFGNEESAAGFDGNGQFVQLPNSSELKPEFPLTIAFWVKYNSLEAVDRVIFNLSLEEDVNNGVFMTSQSSTGKYAIGYGDGDINYAASGSRVFISNAVIDTQDWHHVALVFTGATDMNIYIDCVDPGGSYSGSGGSLSYSSQPGTIGKHDQHTSFSAYEFDGFLDDFRMWNRALTFDEIALTCSSIESELPIVESEFEICPNSEIELPCGDVVSEPGYFECLLTNPTGVDTIYQATVIGLPDLSYTIEAEICNGQEYTLPNNEMVSEEDTYLVVLSDDNECAYTATVILDVADGGDVELFLENGLISTDFEGTASYQWIDCSTSLPVFGASNPTFEPIESGSYQVQISTSECSILSTCIDLDTNIQEEQTSLCLVYPNPASNRIKIESTSTWSYYTISDMSGKVLLRGGQKQRVNIKSLAHGHFILRLFDQNGNLITSSRMLKE